MMRSFLMKRCPTSIAFILFLLTCTTIGVAQPPERDSNDQIIRIAEIEIATEYLQEYKALLKEEAAASMKLEPGVIAIFPMYQRENPELIRIVEIYASQAAYESHLITPHFLRYKTGTHNMVKSLNLVDMEALDRHSMAEIFKKKK